MAAKTGRWLEAFQAQSRAHRSAGKTMVQDYKFCETRILAHMTEEEEIKRFRSFTERYIVERASTFRVGYEKEDAWAAVQDAKTVYGLIESTACTAFARRSEEMAVVTFKERQQEEHAKWLMHKLEKKQRP